VRNKPFFLPLGEIFVHDGFDFAFASEVILGNASEERVLAIACSPWLCSCYPPWPWSSSRPIDAPAGENVKNTNGIAAESYGFVVAQQGDVVTIATGDRVVRGLDGAEYCQVRDYLAC